MPKISSTDNKRIILSFIFRVLVLSAASLLLINSLFSFLYLKLDLDLQSAKYLSFATVSLCSVMISFGSLLGYKQNYMLLSLLSIIPLSLFIIINTIVNRESFLYFCIKIILIVIFSVCIAILKSVRKNRG